MSTTMWRDSTKNPVTKFASATDFLDAEEISKVCRDSYNDYITKENTTQLTKNSAGFIETKWNYIDNEAGFKFQATYNEKFGWGVMRVPAPKQKPETQTETATLSGETIVATGSEKGFAKSTRKQEAVLEDILEELKTMNKFIEIIAQSFVDKGIKPASDIK